MSDESPLSITRDGPVVRAVMDRPARRNALSEAMGAAWDCRQSDPDPPGTGCWPISLAMARRGCW